MTDLTIDTDRLARQGFPEVIYARGKTRQQVITALQTLSAEHGCALATGVTEDLGLGGNYHACSKLYRMGQMPPRAGSPCVISAGTSDQSVAEEAAQTLEFLGYRVHRIQDVGVAGIHRLLSRLQEFNQADALIVVAGMDGALPSVVGGLVAQPVIAVPTSVGYGTSYGGMAALLTMLNSCAAGVTVVNIDNGFGAAIAAARILR